MRQHTAVARARSLGWPQAQPLRTLQAVAQWLRPQEGWLALLLLTANLLVVAWSVEKAGWVDTPSLALTLVLGVITGLALSRLRGPIVLLLPLGLALGFLIIIWQIVSFQPQSSGLSSVGELWERLDLWLDAARKGTISIDPIPFAFLLLTATWLVGHLGAWSLFRYHNYGLVVLLGGFAIVINLTNIAPGVLFDFVLYLFSALLLLTRVQSVRRQWEWRRRGLSYESSLGADYFYGGLWFAVGILLVAYILPLDQGFRPVKGLYKTVSSPVAGLSSDFNRLFAGLPGKKPRPYRDFNDVLPLRGTIKNTDNPVLEVKSAYPMYWKVRSYSSYTSKGWMMGDNSWQAPSWSPDFFVEAGYESRREVTHQITSVFSSKNLFAGSQVVQAERASNIETFASPAYVLNLQDPHWRGLLPPGQEEVAEAVLQASQSPGTLPEVFLQQNLPPQWRLKNVTYLDETPMKFTLTHAVPYPTEILYLHPGEKIKAGESYSLTTSISLATEEELRQAGENYPVWVYARYLQLPKSLPKRVRDMALELTAQAETPFDKATTIEAYLETYPYTREIDPPPFDADGVDYFLFDLQKGYSEYFASSMTVLLRAAGIPARLATGYTQGTQVDEGTFLVRDNDSHAWVEVFFPDYGWIDFEPTPGVQIPPRPEPPSPPRLISRFGSLFPLEEDLIEDELLDDGLGSGPPPSPTVTPGGSRRTWLLFLLIPLIFVALGGVLMSLWVRYMTPSIEPQAAFRRLTFLGALSGQGPRGSQTPYQYRDTLALKLPGHRGDLHVIVDAYVGNLYGRKLLDQEGERSLAAAWKALRGTLLLRIIRRR